MKKLVTIAFLLSLGVTAFAQNLDVKEVWLSGYARSVLYNDFYENEAEKDTVTASRLSSGHTLLDLGVNIKPSKKVFIHGMVRVRNDHGGFWGSGVSLDVRNLYLRGLVGNSFRYQIGDINYKLTPYTLYNTEEETSVNEPQVFQIMRELNQYDLFYNADNSWRQQGVTGDFGLRFKKGIQDMDFSLFTTRQSASFNNGENERLQSGGSVFVKQSNKLDARLTYVNAYEIVGSSASTNRYSNPIVTGGVGVHERFGNYQFDLSSELGLSSETMKVGEAEAQREDYFTDVDVRMRDITKRYSVKLGYQVVGPEFRSIGAQTKRVRWQAVPLAFQRYGNEQQLRSIGMLDLMRDASIYTTQLQRGLMAFNPVYGNAQPYGTATPNRRNIDLAASWYDRASRVKMDMNTAWGTEVIGQGTAALKQFMTLRATADMRLNRFINTQKPWTLEASYWMENTNRAGAESYEDIDFGIQSIGLGMNYQFAKGFTAMVGYRMLQASGNEFFTRRNTVGEIITFEPLSIDFSEDLFALGLRYNFSENSLLNVQWTGYSQENKAEQADPYALSDLSIIYRMKF